MTEVTCFNKKFEKSGSVNTSLDLSVSSIHTPAVHQVVKAYLTNQRSGNASTKTRAFVRGGGAKPFKQKGTGRARQGSTRSPLQVGGAVVFGPLPRTFSHKVNKKVMSKAKLAVLADKFQAGKLFVLDELPTDGKTKTIHQLLEGRNLLNSLIILKGENKETMRACKNLKFANAINVSSLNIHAALKHENMIFEKGAFEEFCKASEQEKNA